MASEVLRHLSAEQRLREGYLLFRANISFSFSCFAVLALCFPGAAASGRSCPWATLAGVPHEGAGELVHSPAQRCSSIAVTIHPVLPFLALEKGAVGAGDGLGPARSPPPASQTPKTLGLKLGHLLRLLLQDETPAWRPSWLLKNQGSGRPCGSGGQTS